MQDRGNTRGDNGDRVQEGDETTGPNDAWYADVDMCTIAGARLAVGVGHWQRQKTYHRGKKIAKLILFHFDFF